MELRLIPFSVDEDDINEMASDTYQIWINDGREESFYNCANSAVWEYFRAYGQSNIYDQIDCDDLNKLIEEVAKRAENLKCL
jgi:hypothetical protein